MRNTTTYKRNYFNGVHKILKTNAPVIGHRNGFPGSNDRKQNHIYRVSRGECARLRENVPYVKVHRYNPKHLYPKLNGYGDNGERKVWSSCGSTYYTCFACCYPYTAHVRPSVSQPSQAHSAFIINSCHSYSEL